MKLCSFDSCRKPLKARGMCKSHYERWRKDNPEKLIRKAGKWDNPDGSRKDCQVPECPYKIETQGVCSKHYQQFHYESTRGASKPKKNRKRRDITGKPLDLRCTFPGCRGREFNPGLCAGHYYQKLRTGELRPLKEKVPCPVRGCSEEYPFWKAEMGVCAVHRRICQRYNLSADEVVELLDNPVCSNPGCGETENLQVDHDHACCPYSRVFEKSSQKSCGQCVRGLLCRPCNKSLGMLQENPRRIQGLLDYLNVTGSGK